MCVVERMSWSLSITMLNVVLLLFVTISCARLSTVSAELSPEDVKYLAKYNARIYAVTNNSVFAFGKDDDNFPLLGKETEGAVVSEPTEIVELRDEAIVQLCSSSRHMLARSTTGRVWAWGSNAHGELGLGSERDYHRRPMMVEVNATIDSITCGHLSSFATSLLGDLYSWGWNKYGQLGHGDYETRNVPTKVNSISNVLSVATSEHWMTMALRLDGHDVVAWGADISSEPSSVEMNGINVREVVMIDNVIIVLADTGMLYKKETPKDAPKLFYSGDMSIMTIAQGGGNRRPQFLVAQARSGGLLVWWDVHANGESSFTTVTLRELALRDDINIVSLAFPGTFYNLLLPKSAV